MYQDAGELDADYLLARLLEMLAIPSPTGFTDELSRYVCGQLEALQVPYAITRRGTIIASIAGDTDVEARAVVNHLDTIGAVVTELKDNGRLAVDSIGTWSSRFAEGGKVSVFSRESIWRGQVLPVLASGHAFNKKIDELPIAWESVEVRLNGHFSNRQELSEAGICSGDFVAFDSEPEVSPDGYICARHLDNKAGAAAVLTALKILQESDVSLPVDITAMFTVTEEVGTGASASLPDNVAEIIGIDIGPVAPGQNARETGVTLCAQDTSGPFDRNMLAHLKTLCRDQSIDYQVDLFRYYYSDANSALKAGHDVREALVTFGTDATHGYERTHMSSLLSVARLLVAYAQSSPVGFSSNRPAC